MKEDRQTDTKGYISYDSTYMKCLEQANLQKQKVNQWLPRAGTREEWGMVAKGYSFFNVLKIDNSDGCTNL